MSAALGGREGPSLAKQAFVCPALCTSCPPFMDSIDICFLILLCGPLIACIYMYHRPGASRPTTRSISTQTDPDVLTTVLNTALHVTPAGHAYHIGNCRHLSGRPCRRLTPCKDCRPRLPLSKEGGRCVMTQLLQGRHGAILISTPVRRMERRELLK